jgi:CheY-like chemotaxis protein
MKRHAPVDTRILVASSDAADAEMVADLLHRDFDDIRVTFDPAKAVEDFESHSPQVLVLAFAELADAKQFYLGLYRLSTRIHAIVHRTVVLCDRRACRRAYELCCKQHFDDYVEFWPVTYDPSRLAMSVLLAARAVAAAVAQGPSRLELSRQAHRILELEGLLQEQSAVAGQRVEAVSQSLGKAESGIREAVDGISKAIFDSPGLTRALKAALAGGLERLGSEGIRSHLQEVHASLAPVRQWFEFLNGEVAPRFGPVRELAESAQAVKPLLLLVDDDPFQRQLLRRMLNGLPLELIFASNGNEALTMLRSHRPDIVLMDVALPDINGVEVIRRIRIVPALARTPVIFITGNSTKLVVAESLHVGAEDFMAKPFSRTRLLASISRLLGPAVKLAAD